MLNAIRHRSERLERSVSWCVQKAWQLAGARLRQDVALQDASLVSAQIASRFSGPTQKFTCLFEPALLQELVAEAARRECSMSSVIQKAWFLAEREIDATFAPTTTAASGM